VLISNTGKQHHDAFTAYGDSCKVPRSVTAAATGKNNVVSCHLSHLEWGHPAAEPWTEEPCARQGTWLVALGAAGVTAFPLLAAVWLHGGKRHLGLLQPCLSGARRVCISSPVSVGPAPPQGC